MKSDMAVRVQSHIVGEKLPITDQYLATSGATLRPRGAVHIDYLPERLVHPLTLEH
jgi:hypothetical protein